jgi:hypothetical protein
MTLTVTIPLVAVVAVLAWAAWRYMGLRVWHLVVCLLLGFLLAATSAAPEIDNLVTAIIHAITAH